MTHTVTVGPARRAGAGQHVTRYDKGKYGNNLRGRAAEVPADVLALWTVKRRDADGPYWALYCLIDLAALPVDVD